MRWFRLHLRLFLLTAILALGGQSAVALESAWHHHDDAPAGHQDSCAVCAAVSERVQPVDPPIAAPTLELTGFLPAQDRQLPAHRFALKHSRSRGPPSTAA